MTKQDSTELDTKSLMATGGGNAAASGIAFQASLGAWFATHLLSERQLNSDLAGGSVLSLRFETESPVDDILVRTSTGWIFVQAKSTVSLSTAANGHLARVTSQFVKQWLTCSLGNGDREWNRPLNRQKDRLLLALGPSAPNTVSVDLAQGLSAIQASGSAPLSKARADAVNVFRKCVREAWKSIAGEAASDEVIRSILNLVTILRFDFAGADRWTPEEMLKHVLVSPDHAGAVFSVIGQQCQELMAARTGCDMSVLQGALIAKGIALAAAPSFQSDIRRLRKYSEMVQKELSEHESTEIDGKDFGVERACTDVVVDGALRDSLLLVGEPGAGKSGVINASADRLKQEGLDVVQLAVDRLPVNSIEGLMTAIGLEHPLREILANWPGNRPGFVFIDALDATRGGNNEAVFRALIEDVISIDGRQWHIIASIRTFDLRMGAQLKELFGGAPVSAEFSDRAFPDVKHVHVPSWTPEELADLLQRAPVLSRAIDTGGERLRDLARVPFNTRLICDLINAGLSPGEFSEIESQVQLLSVYWNHRVEKHGTGAEVCLRTAISIMIEGRVLRAGRLDVARENATVLDKLLHENVLHLLDQGQFVSFRHHILFDYAASRVYLRVGDPKQTAETLAQDKGLGLMLASGLSYSLHQLWNEGAKNRINFWAAIVRLCGDRTVDPVARSVAARTAADLPGDRKDATGFFMELMRQIQSAQIDSKMALAHVVGALVVRLEDKQTVALAPWCELADRASESIKDWAWPIRALLYLIHEHPDSKKHSGQIGRVARSLLASCLDDPNAPVQMTSAAINFVAVTYASDIEGSRSLLSRLFEPARFKDYGDQDIPRLVDRLKVISEADSDFVVEIYARTFGDSIQDGTTTPIGASQILSMVSTRRQDYEGSWWQLKRFFPRFLKAHPVHAVRALTRAISGYVRRAHPIGKDGRVWSVSSPRGEMWLREDRSCIWGWNIDEEHSDSALGLIREYVKHIERADENIARKMIHEITGLSELAVFWARTFMAGALRAKEVGDLLWSFATQEPFLESLDTQKDAIDFIAARYPYETRGSREMFERAAMEFKFKQTKQSSERRKEVLITLFSSIGETNLVTDAVCKLVPNDDGPKDDVRANVRPFRVVAGEGSHDKWWWLRDKGIDPDDDRVALILSATQVIEKMSVGRDGDTEKKAEIGIAITLVTELIETIQANATDLPDAVAQYALGIAAQGAVKLCSGSVKQLQDDKQVVSSLIEVVLRLAKTPGEEWSPEEELDFEVSSAWGSPDAVVEAAQAAMYLCRVDSETVEKLLPTIEVLLVVPNPAARMQIAQGLMAMWNSAQSEMWELAERIVVSESNRGVLRLFANKFLGHARRWNPGRVERLVLLLHARPFRREDEATRLVLAELGSLVSLLSNYNGKTHSLQALNSWTADPSTYEPELRRAISVTRNALTLKYRKKTLQNEEITQRAQEFVGLVVVTLCNGVEIDTEEGQTHSGADSVGDARKLYFRLLDEVCSHIYFGSGAFRSNDREEPALSTNESKHEFLRDMMPTLSRIADVGAAPTIHHLIELLEFLLPGNPAEVFDLVARALLRGGRRSQYQFESLGAERFVEIVGICLADHREMFNEDERRQRLVKCLDVFMDVGWPAARRLVYRLPELLQ